MATLWGELGSKAWLWPPPPHADFPMYVSATGGVGSMVWLGLALHPPDRPPYAFRWHLEMHGHAVGRAWQMFLKMPS